MDVLDALSRSGRSATSPPATNRVRRSWPTCTAASPDAARSRWHAGTGRHEPRHRHRRRLPRPGADGRAHRARSTRRRSTRSRTSSSTSCRCCGPITKWNQRVERVGRDPGDRSQGVPDRAPREARSDPHRAAGEPRLAAAGERRTRWGHCRRRAPTSPSRPTRRSSMPPSCWRGRRGRSSLPGTASCAGGIGASCGPWPAASTSRSRRRSWARAPSTTGRTSRSWLSVFRRGTTC